MAKRNRIKLPKFGLIDIMFAVIILLVLSLFFKIFNISFSFFTIVGLLLFSIIYVILSATFGWSKKIKKHLSITEAFFAVLLLGGLTLFDVTKNIVQEHGVDFLVSTTADFKIKAIFALYIGLFIMIFSMVELGARAIMTRGLERADKVAIFIGTTGIVFLFMNAFISFYLGGDFLVPFFNTKVININLYHFLGVAGVAYTTLYFVLTQKKRINILR